MQQLSVGLLILLFLESNWVGMSCDIESNWIVEARLSHMSETAITSSDRGKTFKVNRGELIVVYLEENPTTGYRWEIEADDSSIVKFLDSHYSKTSEIPGAAKTRAFRFQAESGGSRQIQLRLRRSWEPIGAAIESFEVNIQVQ